MADLVELDIWEAGIYQLEVVDPVEGGPGGIDNRQAQQLANRTKHLKAIYDAHAAASDPHAQYLTAAEGNTAIAAAVAALVASSPAALDTLNEIALALGNDPNFSTTIINALALKITQAQGDARYAQLSQFAGSNQALAANGYQKLPGGLIMQWGSVTWSASADVTWTYPIAFPSAVVGLFGNFDGNNLLGTGAIMIDIQKSAVGNKISAVVGAWNDSGARPVPGDANVFALGY